ncbi:MAG: hypothetical protein WAQ98_10045 [Blastocatellia bacterium]
MAKLKVKTESLPTRCEICHKTDLFDSELGHCYRCVGIQHQHTAMDDQPKAITDLSRPTQSLAERNSRAKQYKNFPTSAGLSVNAIEYQITCEWFSWPKLLILILFVILSLIYKDTILDNISSPLFWLVAGFVGYYLVGNCINHSVITVNNKILKVSNRPLPLGLNTKIPITTVSQINLEEVYEENYFKPCYYNINAKLFTGKTCTLISQIRHPEKAYYIQQQVQEWVNTCRWSVRVEQDRQNHAGRQSQ